MFQLNLFDHEIENILCHDECLVRLHRNFLEDQESFYIRLKNHLNWTQDKITLYGKTHPVPRLQAWYGDPGMSYSYSGIQLETQAWTESLFDLKTMVERQTGELFNSVLCNYYRGGEDHVAWHSDNEKGLGRNPSIASLSLGAGRKFMLRNKKIRSEKYQVDLFGGDLLLMTGSTQTIFEHQVSKTKKCVEGRINLTFRKIIPD